MTATEEVRATFRRQHKLAQDLLPLGLNAQEAVNVVTSHPTIWVVEELLRLALILRKQKGGARAAARR